MENRKENTTMAIGVNYIVRAPLAFYNYLVKDYPFPPADAFNIKRDLTNRGLVITGLARAAEIAAGETDYGAVEVA
jgi:hypothetical protein